MTSLTHLVKSAGSLLSGPAAARLQDLGEVLASSQEVRHRGSALTAQGRSQRLVNVGELFSTCLEKKVNVVELVSRSSEEPGSCKVPPQKWAQVEMQQLFCPWITVYQSTLGQLVKSVFRSSQWTLILPNSNYSVWIQVKIWSTVRLLQHRGGRRPQKWVWKEWSKSELSD